MRARHVSKVTESRAPIGHSPVMPDDGFGTIRGKRDMTAHNTAAQKAIAQNTTFKMTWSGALSDNELDLVVGGSGSGKSTTPTPYPYASRFNPLAAAAKPSGGATN